jgi:hypothetical protein
MRGVSLETCWEVKKHWNNKFYYTVASCWLFPNDLCYDARIHEHQILSPVCLLGKNPLIPIGYKTESVAETFKRKTLSAPYKNGIKDIWYEWSRIVSSECIFPLYSRSDPASPVNLTRYIGTSQNKVLCVTIASHLWPQLRNKFPWLSKSNFSFSFLLFCFHL